MLNYNHARETNYKLILPGKEFEGINYFITTCELPSTSIVPIDAYYQGAQCSVPGNTMTYDDFSFTFMVDEDYSNYFLIYDWLYQIAHGTNKSPLDLYKDLSLHILTNNKTESAIIAFEGAYPTSLGSLSFNSQSTSPQDLSTTCSIKYQKSTLKTRRIHEI